MNTSISRPGIEELRARIRRLEGVAGRQRTVLPFGIKAIDRHLPGGGLALGALHEVAGGGNGAIDGAAAALFAAGIAARTRGKVLWCLTRPDLFAPALAQAGLKSDRVIYLGGGDDKSVLACSRRVCATAGLALWSRKSPAYRWRHRAACSSRRRARGPSAWRSAAGGARAKHPISANRQRTPPAGASRRFLPLLCQLRVLDGHAG
jgi:hypothetical protein